MKITFSKLMAAAFAAILCVSLCGCNVKEGADSEEDVKNREILEKANLVYSATTTEGEPDIVNPPFEDIKRFNTLHDLETASGFRFDFDFAPGSTSSYMYLNGTNDNGEKMIFAQTVHYFDLGAIGETVFNPDVTSPDNFKLEYVTKTSYGNDGVYDIFCSENSYDDWKTWSFERTDDDGNYHIVEFCVYSEDDLFIGNLMKLFLRDSSHQTAEEEQ